MLIGPIEVKHGGGVTYQDSSMVFVLPGPCLGARLAAPSSRFGETTYRDWVRPPSAVAAGAATLLRGGFNVETVREPPTPRARLLRARCKRLRCCCGRGPL